MISVWITYTVFLLITHECYFPPVYTVMILSLRPANERRYDVTPSHWQGTLLESTHFIGLPLVYTGSLGSRSVCYSAWDSQMPTRSLQHEQKLYWNVQAQNILETNTGNEPHALMLSCHCMHYIKSEWNPHVMHVVLFTAKTFCQYLLYFAINTI